MGACRDFWKLSSRDAFPEQESGQRLQSEATFCSSPNGLGRAIPPGRPAAATTVREHVTSTTWREVRREGRASFVAQKERDCNDGLGSW